MKEKNCLFLCTYSYTHVYLLGVDRDCESASIASYNVGRMVNAFINFLVVLSYVTYASKSGTFCRSIGYSNINTCYCRICNNLHCSHVLNSLCNILLYRLVGWLDHDTSCMWQQSFLSYSIHIYTQVSDIYTYSIPMMLLLVCICFAACFYLNYKCAPNLQFTKYYWLII